MGMPPRRLRRREPPARQPRPRRALPPREPRTGAEPRPGRQRPLPLPVPLRRRGGGGRLRRAAVREDGLEESRELGKGHLYPPVAEPGGAGQGRDRRPPAAEEPPPPPADSDTSRL